MSLFDHRPGVPTPPSPEVTDADCQAVGKHAHHAGGEAHECTTQSITPSALVQSQRKFKRGKRRTLPFFAYLNRHIPASVRRAIEEFSSSSELLPSKRPSYTSPRFASSLDSLSQTSTPLLQPSSSSFSLSSPFRPADGLSLPSPLSGHQNNTRLKPNNTRVTSHASSRVRDSPKSIHKAVTQSTRLSTLRGLPSQQSVHHSQHDRYHTEPEQSSSSQVYLPELSQTDLTTTSTDEFSGLLDLRLWPVPSHINPREVSRQIPQSVPLDILLILSSELVPCMSIIVPCFKKVTLV